MKISAKQQKIISRDTSMKLLYQIDITKTEIKDIKVLIDSFLYNNKDIIEERFYEIFNTKDVDIEDMIDKKYITEIIETLKNKIEEIDSLINKNAKNWSVNRMPKVDLAILRLSICEIIANNEIPTKVSINEAIELSKVYCDDKTPKFINGILGSIVNELF